ncbi:DinB family protein [Risungbinella massiliensis]|uniref:DinB family protein n=1 Tax=Risungbinella massiliensis TaxID=1329796 RepID=UPI0005CBAC49|nr:DinB family protein [Risungbinella massiliensis]
MLSRPEKSEYAPFYSTYIDLVPDGDLFPILQQQIEETISLLQDTTEIQSQFRYAPDKWSLKEVIGHIADGERVMSYRALCIARGETQTLPGFDEKIYNQNATFHHQSMEDLLANMNIVRQSTIHLLKGLSPEVWLRRGMVIGFEITVRALVSIIAGHELHHRQIIKERYMSSDSYPSK